MCLCVLCLGVCSCSPLTRVLFSTTGALKVHVFSCCFFDTHLFVFVFVQSRFDTREHVQRGWSMRGQPVDVAAEFDAVRSWSVSCLTDLSHTNGFLITQPVSGIVTDILICAHTCRYQQRIGSLGNNGKVSTSWRSSQRRHYCDGQLQNSPSS